MTRARVAAAVLLAFGLVGAFEAHRLVIGSARQPGPGFFPFWLSLALVVVSLALLLRRAAPAGMPAAGAIPIAEPPLRRSKVVLTLLAGLGYALVVESLGFTVTTFLFLVFLLMLIERRRPVTALVLAGSTALASYVVFKVWLAVQLPDGPWGF